MKYILTRDFNIYFAKSYEDIGQDALKIADTLDGLCEAFIVAKNQDRTVYKPRDFNKTSHKLLKQDVAIGYKKVYGGIWQDLNLIVIAKMNEKGEWTLL